MVKTKLVLFLFLCGLTCSSLISQASAQREYYFGQEWAKIWINQDGSIDLFYNVSITLDLGDDINWVSIGQPKADFTIDQDQTQDQYGNILQASDISTSDDYKVRVDLNSPLREGETIWFTLLTNVAQMIYEDQTNSGNDGMQFTLSWFSEATILDSRITIVLPPQVTQSEVTTGTLLWNNTQIEQERLEIYWDKQNSIPDERFTVGVSYPKQQGWTSFTQNDTITDLFENFWILFMVAGLILAILVVVLLSKRKQPYLKPSIGIESLGILRGLTAIEASYLLDLKPPKIVTEILYSLLKKRAVWVKSTTPSLKFTIQKPYENKAGTKQNPLRYYEIDFLKAIKKNGTLDEQKLAKTIMFLRSTVEEKLKGYCRADTIQYYKKIVTKAWKQVQTAKTSKIASKAYDEQLLWLFLDSKLQDKTKNAFKNQSFDPNPLWFWYWYSHGQNQTPNRPITKPPTQKTPTIPGAEFANNIATAVENSANNFVVNLEKFANSILPPPPKPKTSKQPAHTKAKCVCACAACACACACVSCACACAGGGVG